MIPPKKILILRFSSLGDILMSTAMLRCVATRWPEAEIHWVVRREYSDLFRHNPHIHRIWGLDRGAGWRGLWRLAQDLKGHAFDIVYDAHRSLRTRLLMPVLRSPQSRTIFFKKQYVRRALALTFKLPLLDGRRFLERFTDPWLDLGVHYDGGGPELWLDPQEQKQTRQAWSVGDGLWVGLVPSAQWPGKRWPAASFRALLDRLLQTTQGRFIVFGGAKDTFCSEIVKGLAPDRVINTAGRLGLLEVGALLSACKLVVANDTGLLHMADALGIPTVGIFGPTSEALGCLPHHPQSAAVERILWCRPCSKNGQAPCIRIHRPCLTKLPVEQVYDQVRSAMNARGLV